MQYKILVYLFFLWVFNICVCLYHSMCIYKWIWICIIRSVVVEIAAVLWGRNDVDNKIAQTICWQILLYVFFPIPTPSPPFVFVFEGFCGIFGISGKPTKCIRRFVFNLLTWPWAGLQSMPTATTTTIVRAVNLICARTGVCMCVCAGVRVCA